MRQSKYNLSNWQVVLIIIGVALIWGPSILDLLEGAIEAIKNFINLEFIFSRSGAIAIGVILLGIVAVSEFIKDYIDKPDSDYVQ